jgi:hypothetical protein
MAVWEMVEERKAMTAVLDESSLAAGEPS